MERGVRGRFGDEAVRQRVFGDDHAVLLAGRGVGRSDFELQ